MSDVVVCYDSTNPDSIPSDVEACAGYCDGLFAGVWLGMVHRFPKLSEQQRVVSIGSRAGTVCRIFDVEPGNPLTPSEAAAEVVKMVHRGVYKPGIYCDGADMPAARAAMRATGMARTQYSLWLADPTGAKPTLAQLDADDLDGIQYAWASKGQAPVGTDISAFRPDFFPPEVKPVKPVKKHRIHIKRPAKPHPKVTAALLGSTITTAVLALLAKHGAPHAKLTTAETAAITGAAASLFAHLRKSK